MAAARSHAARLIFQQRPSCFTWIRLYDTNSLQHGGAGRNLNTEQVRQIYSAAVFLHNPNSRNTADGGALYPPVWTRVGSDPTTTTTTLGWVN